MDVEMRAEGLNEIVAVLGEVPIKVHAASRAIVQKGAHNVKTEAQQLASGLAHAPHYPRSITYETDINATGAEAVIGPDKNRRQGALGNILEYGTSENPPFAHLGPALDREGPRFEQAMTEMVEKLL
jgi:hypothetical protein